MITFRSLFSFIELNVESKIKIQNQKLYFIKRFSIRQSQTQAKKDKYKLLELDAKKDVTNFTQEPVKKLINLKVKEHLK